MSNTKIETENKDFSKYGVIYKCLRIASDKSLNDIAEDLSMNQSYLALIETGKIEPRLISFMSLCKGYDIKPSKFMEIAEKVYDNDLSYQEILLECAKHESMKSLKGQTITDDEKKRKLGLILKGMRVAQGKTCQEVADEISVSVPMISIIENKRPVSNIKKFKKYISFFKISDEDFDLFYNLVISKNLSYQQILTYCLIHDIERQKKEQIEEMLK